MYSSRAAVTMLIQNGSSVSSDLRAEDFLIGKEKYCQTNNGNSFVREWTQSHFREYKGSKDKLDYMDPLDIRTKPVIISECLSALKNRGGRFLEKAQGKDGTFFWKEASEDKAREVVVGCFRNHNRNDKKRKSRIGASTPGRGDPLALVMASPESKQDVRPRAAQVVTPSRESFRGSTREEWEVGSLILLSCTRTKRMKGRCLDKTGS